jgi:hypothetical protein
MAGFLTGGVTSLFAKQNKAKKNESEIQEGLIDELGELELSMDDLELLTLAESWERLYDGSELKKRICTAGDNNFKYWKNRQFPEENYSNNKRPLTDNIIFDGVETLVPLATQQNPDCVILTNSEDPTLKENIHTLIEYLADRNNLRDKLKKATRNWLWRYVGVVKATYSAKDNEITAKSINPKNMILDPNAFVEDGRYIGEFAGELMEDKASDLVKKFPKKEKEIKELCNGKMGSVFGYKQFWTDDYVFYKLKNIILFKSKNPNWNYPDETTEIDELGKEIVKSIPGKNHLGYPQMPYFFVTVFNDGESPADQTSLIEQGLPTQDNINKHIKQVDKNVDNINGGIAVNGENFNKEQAAQITEARRTGKTIVTPGKPQDSIYSFVNQEIPSSVFKMIDDQRERFLQRFGTSGTSNSGDQEQTVRGKIIEGNNDSSRIGGGITSSLELVASQVYNYWLQMVYVYYDTPHMVAVLGAKNTQEMIQFSANDIPEGTKIVIKVQDGSMVPQDELSIYNEAMNLWENGVLDPLSLFEKLKDSNPQERTTRLMMYKTNPAQYMAQYLQVMPTAQAQPLAEGGGGSASGQPPSSVPAMQPSASPIQQQESQLLNKVNI